ncbi:hypothetical protein F504_1391 [Ralstonia pseudosolanacearum FQY_4]|nr:hypothetical protein F504_1391 [Ralstonia pseudosolanacearum FQY_4]
MRAGGADGWRAGRTPGRQLRQQALPGSSGSGRRGGARPRRGGSGGGSGRRRSRHGMGAAEGGGRNAGWHGAVEEMCRERTGFLPPSGCPLPELLARLAKPVAITPCLPP